MQRVVPPTHVAPVDGTRREPLTLRLVVALDRGILRVARRWLAAANALLSAWFMAVLLAPLLRLWGEPALARPIYGLFALLCHQDPARSLSVGGHPLACCSRCAAIYGAGAAAGLGFVAVRDRLRRVPPAAVALLVLPAAVDGLGGLVGLWESTTVSRLVTGALCGAGVVWLLYPWLDRGFGRIRERLEALFARLAAEGRFR